MPRAAHTSIPAQALLDCTRAMLRPCYLTGVALRSDELSQVRDAPPRKRQNTGTTPCSKTNTTASFALALPRNINELRTDCDVCLSHAVDVLCVRTWRAPCLNPKFCAMRDLWLFLSPMGDVSLSHVFRMVCNSRDVCCVYSFSFMCV